MQRAMLAVALVSVPYAVFGQVPAKSSVFEVASIKASNSMSNAIGGGVCLSGGRVRVRNITLNLIIELAYDVKEFQLLGRPSWLTSRRFDIEARAASPVGYDQCKLMLQALLADRFRLAVHSETRHLPVYNLLVGKNGPKLHKLDADAPLGIKTFNTSLGQLITRGISMPQLAGMLGSVGELENLVVDATGLEGYYEFTLEWTPDSRAADAPGPSLFSALQEQLGLRLEAGKKAVQVLVIDHVEKFPTEN